MFSGTDKAISYVHIPANQILNNLLALGYECYFHQSRFDDNWIECQNGLCSLSNYEYPYEFFRNAQRNGKIMMTKIPLGGNITKVGPVELSFELIANSLRNLNDWYRENKGKEWAFADMTKYLKMLGISGGLVDGKG